MAFDDKTGNTPRRSAVSALNSMRTSDRTNTTGSSAIDKFASSSKRSEITSKVKEIIASEIGLDVHEISNNSHFRNDLGMDSLDAVSCVMQVEKEFGIDIPDDVAENINTVTELVNYVERDL